MGVEFPLAGEQTQAMSDELNRRDFLEAMGLGAALLATPGSVLRSWMLWVISTVYLMRSSSSLIWP